MAPSSTIDKQKLRREREEREQAANASAGRTKRLKLLGLAGGIAAILVCALVLISRSGSDEPAPAKGGGSKPAQVGSLAGIPQHGNVLGDPKAPVTLVEFADLQCPYCGYVATKGALPTVIDRYVRTGKVKVELNLLGFVGPESRKAALVAAAASRQDKMWQFSEAFFANQGEENTGYVTNSFLSSLAAKVPGLDAGKALSQSQGAPAKSIVAHWSSEGHAAQISGTPSFFVRTGDGGATQINVQLDDVGSFSGPLDHALAG
jgi:protein-disulfide isomerase